MSNQIQCCSCFKFYDEEFIAINEFLGDENHVEVVCVTCSGGEVWDNVVLDAYHDAMDSKVEASVVGVSEAWKCTCTEDTLCDECDKHSFESWCEADLPF